MYILSPDEEAAIQYMRELEEENKRCEYVRDNLISICTFRVQCQRFQKTHVLIVGGVGIGEEFHYRLEHRLYRVRDHSHIPTGLFMLGYVVNALDAIYWYQKHIQVADKHIFLDLFKKAVLHPVGVLMGAMKRYVKPSGERKLHQDVIYHVYMCLRTVKRVVLRWCLRETKRNGRLSHEFRMKMTEMGDFISDAVIPTLRALGDFDLRTKDELRGTMPGDEHPYPDGPRIPAPMEEVDANAPEEKMDDPEDEHAPEEEVDEKAHEIMMNIFQDVMEKKGAFLNNDLKNDWKEHLSFEWVPIPQ